MYRDGALADAAQDANDHRPGSVAATILGKTIFHFSMSLGRASRSFMWDQELSETGMQGLDPNGLDRDLDLVMMVLAGAAGGLSEMEPARGFIGGGLETLRVDEVSCEPAR